LPVGTAVAVPPSRGAKWLLAAALLLQAAWITALIVMSLFVRWR
jgi:hypothetical protein